MHVRILVLTVVVFVLVSGFGVGIGFRAGVPCVVPSGAVDHVDDACMDGSYVYDVIHTGCNSVIQGFSEYHNRSCARLNALQNSRMERGHHVQWRNTERPRHGFLVQGQAVSLEKARLFPSNSQ